MISFPLFDQFPFITHFCTTRQGGVSKGAYASNNLSPFSGDAPIHFAENRNRLCNNLGISSHQLVIPFQTHGTEIREIDSAFFQLNPSEQQDYLHGIDALITSQPNVCIGVTTADCVPLLFVDKEKKVVAAAHAGWRGTCARMGEKVLSCFKEKYNSDINDVLVVIAPSISVEVYEVGEELVTEFEEKGFPVSQIFKKQNEKNYLDLWKANQWLLLENGIKPENIEIAGICTYTNHEQFFSARRLGIASGRILSGIMLK